LSWTSRDSAFQFVIQRNVRTVQITCSVSLYYVWSKLYRHCQCEVLLCLLIHNTDLVPVFPSYINVQITCQIPYRNRVPPAWSWRILSHTSSGLTFPPMVRQSSVTGARYGDVSKSFRTESITTYTLTFGIARWEATQRVMSAKLTRLTYKIAIQLHLVAEGCTICSSRSRWPVRKLLDTPSYSTLTFSFCTSTWWDRLWGPPSLLFNGYQRREADQSLHLVPRSRMHGAIPPLPEYFIAWCSVKA
jgi:hypothetical protein